MLGRSNMAGNLYICITQSYISTQQWLYMYHKRDTYFFFKYIKNILKRNSNQIKNAHLQSFPNYSPSIIRRSATCAASIWVGFRSRNSCSAKAVGCLLQSFKAWFSKPVKSGATSTRSNSLGVRVIKCSNNKLLINL